MLQPTEPTLPTSTFTDAHPKEVRRISAWIADRLHDADKEGIFGEVVTLTPAQCEHILTHHNTRNRKLRLNRVDEWADAIAGGRFQTMSQGISFATDGALNNGQHRLAGAVKAGRSIRVFCVFGEAVEAFHVIDTQAVRGASDALTIAGISYGPTVAAAARLLHFIEAGIVNPSNRRITNDVIIEYVSAHPELKDVALQAQRIGKKFRSSTAASGAALYLIKTKSRHPEKLDDFVNTLLEGTNFPSRQDPILALRDGLQEKTIDRHFRRDIQRVMAQAAAIVRTWNLFLTKQSARRGLRWTGGEFPSVR